MVLLQNHKCRAMEQNRKPKLYFTLVKDLNVINIDCNNYSHMIFYKDAMNTHGRKESIFNK